jgi:uncharacterized lipoprotein YajG
MKKPLLLLIPFFISCSVNPYYWIDSNKSIPNNQFSEKSFSIIDVVDARKKSEYNHRHNSILMESIKNNFNKELSRHFIIGDANESDLKLTIELKEFSYFNNENWKKDMNVYWLISAGFIGAEIAYLLSVEEEYLNGAKINTDDDEILKNVFIGAGVIWTANTIRIFDKIFRGKYLREYHKIQISATLLDDEDRIINTYNGSASGKFTRKKGSHHQQYYNEINSSLSDVFNQIIKQIYADEDMIKTHFN